MGKPKSKICEVRVQGPLAAIAEDFRFGLLDAGYTPLTTVNKLRSVGYLSRWLETRELEPSDLTKSVSRSTSADGERRVTTGRFHGRL